ncbi:MAG: diguanylate cyclase [Nitrosospira sp.]
MLAISLFVVITIALLSYRNIQIGAQAEENSRISRSLGKLSRELLTRLTDAETSQRGYILTGRSPYLEPYNSAVIAIPRLIEQFKSLAISERTDQYERVQALEPLILEKLAELRSTVELRQAGKRTEAEKILESDRGKLLMDEIRGDFSTIEHVADARIQEFTTATSESSRRLMLVGVFGSSLLFIFLVISVILICRSMTLRDALYRELDADKELLVTTLNSIDDAVITTDIAGKVTYLNPAGENMTGWSMMEARALPLAEVFQIVNSQTNEAIPSPVALILQGKEDAGLALHTVLIQRSGAVSPIEHSAAPIRNRHGDLIGTVLIFHDVTHALEIAKQMTHEAAHDALTGLVNRREFERRLDYALQTARQDKKEYTLLFIDLDHFKSVNDMCGHQGGDELLRQLTSMLQARLRRNDTLARLGGDEFGVLLESCPAEPALRVAEQLRKAVHEFAFLWNDRVFQVSLSIGLATFSAGNEVLADIIRMADTACYLAKNNGRNRVEVYAPHGKKNASNGYERALHVA